MNLLCKLCNIGVEIQGLVNIFAIFAPTHFRSVSKDSLCRSENGFNGQIYIFFLEMAWPFLCFLFGIAVAFSQDLERIRQNPKNMKYKTHPKEAFYKVTANSENKNFDRLAYPPLPTTADHSN